MQDFWYINENLWIIIKYVKHLLEAKYKAINFI